MALHDIWLFPLKKFITYIFLDFTSSDDGYIKTFSDVAVEELLKAPYIEIRGMPFYPDFGLDNGYLITYTKLAVPTHEFHRIRITTPGVLRLLK